MLADATESPDISSFKDTDIFKQCRALGIIPDNDPKPATKQPCLFENQPEIPEDIENDHLLPLRLSVEGMWCPACAWVIENTLLKHKGVFKASCNFSPSKVWGIHFQFPVKHQNQKNKEKNLSGSVFPRF